ncbi:MAG TPA: hypothetical protein VIM11_16845 [Tepidisphaeraceae bacterium]|jgi:hypothetical protein
MWTRSVSLLQVARDSHARICLWAVVALAFSALQGCGKSVFITSSPPGARIQIFEMKNGVTTPAPVVDAAAPVRKTLDFPEGVSYKVVATLPQYLTDDKTVIEKEPKDKVDYAITLTRYLKDVPYISFAPRFVDNLWTLVPVHGTHEGYILEKDYLNERLNHVQNLKRITNNDERPLVENHELVDIRSCVMSPTADALVYQKVIEHIIDESEHVTPKDEKDAETLPQIAAANNVRFDDITRDNPDIPPSGPLKPETHVAIKHREMTSQIWKQVIDTPVVTPISPNNVQAMFPGFTFNGDSVLFASDNISPNALLWRMQLEGGGTKMVRITSSDSLDFFPSGGQQSIAYTSIPRRAKSPEIWLCRPDGGEPSLITEGEAPQIAPSGDKILYTRLWTAPGGKQSVRQLWIMNINGGVATQLTHNKDFDVIDPKWDSDGKWIVYSSNEGKDARGVHNFDIWLATADGRQTLQLTSDGSDDTSPSFDRSGNFIYFRSNRGGFWNVWRCELTPEVRKQMTH